MLEVKGGTWRGTQTFIIPRRLSADSSSNWKYRRRTFLSLYKCKVCDKEAHSTLITSIAWEFKWGCSRYESWTKLEDLCAGSSFLRWRLGGWAGLQGFPELQVLLLQDPFLVGLRGWNITGVKLWRVQFSWTHFSVILDVICHSSTSRDWSAPLGSCARCISTFISCEIHSSWRGGGNLTFSETLKVQAIYQ